MARHRRWLTASSTDNAERLAAKLDALAVGLLFPLVLTHGVARNGQIPRAGEHMAQRQLCHGFRGSLRRVLHGDAVFLGILHVDVVDADAAADDELQLAALGLIDVVRADLGLRADDDRVKLAQRRAQLIRLVELLDDLMPQLAELCHGLLVHSIGNENLLPLPGKLLPH